MSAPSFNFNFKKIYNFLSPRLEIGGLAINDAHLRFILIKNNERTETFSLPLEAGVIESGKVKDKIKLTAALSRLRSQITKGKKRNVFAVVAIPDFNVYTEVFSLPLQAMNNLEEAARLNLRMISPLNMEEAYADWQLISKSSDEGLAEMEVMAAFANKKIIGDYEESLSQAGFETMAIEFSNMASVRVLTQLGGLSDDKNYLALRLGGDGLFFSLVKKGALLFSRSLGWDSLYGERRQVSLEDFENIVIEETRKTISFYETHSNEPLDRLILTSSFEAERLIKLISEKFSLQASESVFGKFNDLSLGWQPALGAALRGLMPPAKDKLITLSSVDSKEKFIYYRFNEFITLWGETIIVFLAVFLMFFSVFDIVVNNNLEKLSAQDKNFSGKNYLAGNLARVNQLKEFSADFNKKVDLLYAAYAEKSQWSALFDKLSKAAEGKVSLGKISIQSSDVPIFINGEAPSEDNLFGFKDALANDPQFSNISLPLSNIVSSPDHTIHFTLSFNFKF